MPALAPISPGGTAILAVIGTTGRVSIAALGNGDQIMVTSQSSNAPAFIKFGDATVAATVNDTPILPGTVQTFTIPPGATNVAAIGVVATNLYFTRGDGI